MAGLAICVVGLHLLGVWGPPGVLWGVSEYAFLPRPVLIGALLGLGITIAIALLLLHAPSRGWFVRLGRHLSFLAHPLERTATILFASAGAFALFWSFRERHRFLGDAMVLVQDIPTQTGVHPLEPISMALQRQMYVLAHAWFERPGLEPGDVAHLTTALGSALAGVLFVFTAWGIARELVWATDSSRHRSVPESSDPESLEASHSTTAPTPALVAVTWGVLLAQGYMQLFFGYVENYTFLALAIGYYVSTALAFLNGRGGLLPVVLACSVAICLHLSAAALLPSLGVVLAITLTSSDLRAVARRDAVPTIVLLLIMATMLASIGSGYDLVGNLMSTVQRLASGLPDPAAVHYEWSLEHARDILNEQLLIGPFAAVMLAPLLLGLRRPAAWMGMRTFVLTLAGTMALVALFAGDSNLGYARNWDLLAPLGIPLTTAALYLMLEQARDRTRLLRTLLVAAGICAFHSLSWVAVNASLERSLARFKTLPLGAGRTESTVGYWYASQGDPDQALPWLALSLQENPDNARARLWLGHVFMMKGRTDEAVYEFQEAVRLRPGILLFQLALINGAVLAHRPGEALAEAQRLVTAEPENPRLWAVLGTVLLSMQRSLEAWDAFGRAAVLAPHERVYAELRDLARTPNGLAQILNRYWMDLTL